MKIYGIMQDYEGYLDDFFQDKKHAEKYLTNFLTISGKEDYADEFRILEIVVK
jgi:hypothetical protein